MESLAPELALHVLGFAGPKATAVYKGSCRSARRFVEEQDEALFKPPTIARPFISSPLPPSHDEAEAEAEARNNARAAEAFKDCLRLASWRDVWETTTRLIGLPCLGVFHLLPEHPVQSLDELRGAWIRVSLNTRVHALSLEPFMDFAYPGPCLMDLPRVAKASGGLLQLEPGNNCFMHADHLVPHAQGEPTYRIREAGGSSTLSFVPFNVFGDFRPLSVPRLSPTALPADRTLRQGLCGLWMGIYGPHGRELLHVRFVELGEEEWGGRTEAVEANANGDADGAGGDDSDGSRTHVVLEGLKITGDPNVPAGNWSFRVDLHHPRDVQAALAADTRPVFTAATEGPVDHAIIDLEEEAERGRLCGIYPGRGQINHVPGAWNPEAVDVDLVVFKGDDGGADGGAEAGSGIRGFGILWRDEDHPLRHCIMFERLPEEAWEQEALLGGRVQPAGHLT